LRFDCTAQKAEDALNAGIAARNDIPKRMMKEFDSSLEELRGFKQRCLAYTFHIRESNICKMLRSSIKSGKKPNPVLVVELKELLKKDLKNQGENNCLQQAINLLDKNIYQFLQVYFVKPPKKTNTLDMYFNDSIPANVKTVWTITSK